LSGFVAFACTTISGQTTYQSSNCNLIHIVLPLKSWSFSYDIGTDDTRKNKRNFSKKNISIREFPFSQRDFVFQANNNYQSSPSTQQ
jgi:hypothetical protein